MGRIQLIAIPQATDLGRGPYELEGVGIAFITTTWITFLLRVYTRAIMTKSFGVDDWSMAATMVTYTIQCVYLTWVGITEEDPEKLQQLPRLAKLITNIIVGSSCYVATAVLLKVSLAFFFLRIVREPWERKVIYIITIVYTTYGTVYLFLVLFGCGNPKDYMLHTAEGTCVSVKNVLVPMSYAAAAANAFTDWIFVILPLHTLWNLQMPRVTKIWASLLVVMGALGSVISLVRLKSVGGLVPGAAYLRNSSLAIILATVEVGLGITAVSLATLRPLFKELLGKMGTTFLGSSKNRTTDGDGTVGPGSKGQRNDNPRVSFGSKPAPMRMGFRECGSDDDLSSDGVELTRVSQDDLARLELARVQTAKGALMSQEDLEKGMSVDDPYLLHPQHF